MKTVNLNNFKLTGCFWELYKKWINIAYKNLEELREKPSYERIKDPRLFIDKI